MVSDLVFIELETLGRQRLGRVPSTPGPDAAAMMEGHAVSVQVDLEAAAVTKAFTRARRGTVSTAFKASCQNDSPTISSLLRQSASAPAASSA
jgi:hypothetical protein